MAYVRIQELEADIANRDQVLKATYAIVDQLRSDQVFEASKNEELIAQIQDIVNDKEREICQLKERYSPDEANNLKARLNEDAAFRKRLEEQLANSQDVSLALETGLADANKKIEKLEQAIEQQDIVHWRLIEKLQAKHNDELSEANKRQQDAMVYAETELKMASEYFEEAKKLEDERHGIIVDELTYDIGRLHTATINYVNESCASEGAPYASALVEIGKLKKELRSCRSVVDGFKQAAEDWEQKYLASEKQMNEHQTRSQSELSELKRELTVLRATACDNELAVKQETLKIDLMSSQYLLAECRRQLEHADSLVLSHQRDKSEAFRERDDALDAARTAGRVQAEMRELANEAQKSADNWKRECEDARRLCVTNISEDLKGNVISKLSVVDHEVMMYKESLVESERQVSELRAANESLLRRLAMNSTSSTGNLENALGISKTAKYRNSLALGDGEGLVDSQFGDGQSEVDDLQREIQRVHRCLDGAVFASKQAEEKHAQEVGGLREQIATMEKEFGDRRRALQVELELLKDAERKRIALVPELSTQGKTFQDMTVEHLETLLQEEKQLNKVLEFRVGDAERKATMYEAESSSLRSNMEHSSSAQNNLEFKMHSLLSEIALHRSMRGLRSPGVADQLVVLSKTAQEFVPESVKETAYLCWALVRVFDGDGKDLSEFRSVDVSGVSKPYRLPQSSWSINRAVFSSPHDLLCSLDRITPQMITPFKSHPVFSQLKELANKRTGAEVSNVSMSCGYVWGWIANTLEFLELPFIAVHCRVNSIRQ